MFIFFTLFFPFSLTLHYHHHHRKCEWYYYQPFLFLSYYLLLFGSPLVFLNKFFFAKIIPKNKKKIKKKDKHFEDKILIQFISRLNGVKRGLTTSSRYLILITISHRILTSLNLFVTKNMIKKKYTNRKMSNFHPIHFPFVFAPSYPLIYSTFDSTPTHGSKNSQRDTAHNRTTLNQTWLTNLNLTSTTRSSI